MSPILCPSAQAKKGAQLIGMVNEKGNIDLMNHPIKLAEDFVSVSDILRKPESRFRFADTCMKGACSQWNGQRCGIIDKILNQTEKIVSEARIPDCAIRSHCRWFNQTGYDACKICTSVVTDVTDLHQTNEAIF